MNGCIDSGVIVIFVWVRYSSYTWLYVAVTQGVLLSDLITSESYTCYQSSSVSSPGNSVLEAHQENYSCVCYRLATLDIAFSSSKSRVQSGQSAFMMKAVIIDSLADRDNLKQTRTEPSVG